MAVKRPGAHSAHTVAASSVDAAPMGQSIQPDAPGTGPRRLLWFAVTTLVAGALAVRAFMSGS